MSTCDLLNEAAVTSRDPSTWSTISSPHFTVFQRIRKCWNDFDDAEGRILTGKNTIRDPDPEFEDLDPVHHYHVQRHYPAYQADESNPPPAFAGFSGGSFYQVDAIDKKSIYSYPDQPVKPVYEPVKPVFVDPTVPVIIEAKQFFDPTLSKGKTR